MQGSWSSHVVVEQSGMVVVEVEVDCDEMEVLDDVELDAVVDVNVDAVVDVDVDVEVVVAGTSKGGPSPR